MRKIKLFFLSILLILSFIFIPACLINDQKDHKVFELQYGTLTKSVSALGTVKAQKEEDILASIEGIISSINASEGDLVRKGQVLISLFSREIEENMLHLSEKVNRIKTEIIKANYEYKNAEKDYEKADKLYLTNAISGDELEKKKNSLNYSKSLLYTKKELLQIVNKLLVIEKLKLARTSIKSPIAGVVITLPEKIKKGHSVIKGQLLLTVAKTSDISIESFFDEVDGRLIKIGQKVNIEGPVLGEQVLSANISKVAPIIEDGKLKVLLHINDLTSLKIGNRVELEIITAKKEKALIVPIESIHRKGQKEYLFVLTAKNRIKKIEVSTGISNLEFTEIFPNKYLKEGVRILVL